jgi:hypothetical protein
MNLMCCAVAIAAAGVMAMTHAEENEHKIARSELPPAVERTVTEQSQGATIHGFSEERENGATYYEVELVAGGHGKDVLIDANGKVVEIEEEVALESVPAKVRTELETKAKGDRIAKVEALSKDGRIVAYEAAVGRGAKAREIEVTLEN